MTATTTPDSAERSLRRGEPKRNLRGEGSTESAEQALSSVLLRGQAVQFRRESNHDPSLAVVRLDEDLLNRAFVLFKYRPDKNWSLTDCISFVVMGDRGITEALTGDRDFEQAGFRIAFK